MGRSQRNQEAVGTADIGTRHPRRLRTTTFIAATVLVFFLDSFMTVPQGDTFFAAEWTLFDRYQVRLFPFVFALLVAYIPLLWRRQHAMVVLCYVAALSVLITTSHPWSMPVAGSVLALYTAGATLRPLLARWALAVATSSVLGNYFIALQIQRLAGDGVSIVGLVIMGTMTVGVWTLGRREYGSTRTTDDLVKQLEARGSQAAEEERHRIARELHDILAHSVSAMMMQAAGARAMSRSVARDIPQDQRMRSVDHALSSIETTGSQSMRELHRLLATLREDGGDLSASPSAPPGLTDLEDLASVGRESGLVVHLHRDGTPVPLDPSVDAAAYRVVQESLTNAMKHAGRDAVVDIFESWAPDSLRLQVRSRGGHDGTRPDTPNSGTGLYGLRRRVEIVGGTLETGWAGEEYVTAATWPLTSDQDDAATEHSR